jgi:bifunctional DNA-binding transcriptional regulator/antitoxin component of YhaV-PrlF toxin-antitoxin module
MSHPEAVSETGYYHYPKKGWGSDLPFATIGYMKRPSKPDTIYFNERGQVAIPRWLRLEFNIEKGTRALVYKDGDAIVLQPITPNYIHKLRGSLKGSGVLESLLEDRKREREL